MMAEISCVRLSCNRAPHGPSQTRLKGGRGEERDRWPAARHAEVLRSSESGKLGTEKASEDPCDLFDLTVHVISWNTTNACASAMPHNYISCLLSHPRGRDAAEICRWSHAGHVTRNQDASSWQQPASPRPRIRLLLAFGRISPWG